MRLSVVGSPIAEADTVRVYLDRWTLGEWEQVDFFFSFLVSEVLLRDALHLFSHVPQVAVRFGSGDCYGSDKMTRLKNRVAVKAERQ